MVLPPPLPRCVFGIQFTVLGCVVLWGCEEVSLFPGSNHDTPSSTAKQLKKRL